MLSKVLSDGTQHPSRAVSSTNTTNLYEDHFSRALNPATREAFWAEQTKTLEWHKQPTTILDQSNPPFFRWFTDGELSISHNCLDRHVKNGLGSQVAIFYESPLINVSAEYTYAQLLDLVSRFANVLQRHGVKKGDRVVIYMPNIPEVLVAMHACARIGAVHLVVYGGFIGRELASQVINSRPKVIVSASCGLGSKSDDIIDYKPMLDEAYEIASMPEIKNIIVQRDVQKCILREGIDFDFYDELAKAQPVEPVILKANDYLYILYTSGTTGAPKGLIRDVGSTAVCLAYQMKHALSIDQGDAVFMASDIGWVSGHAFINYGPQLVGAKAVLYEGKPTGTPDAGTYWRICEKRRVKSFITAPTPLKVVRREDPDGRYIKEANLSSLENICCGGEKIDSSTFEWLTKVLPKTSRITCGYGQTETNILIAGYHIGLSKITMKPGSCGKLLPGFNVTILDDQGNSLPPNQNGEICIKHPLCPNFISTIYNDDKAFVEKYMTRYPSYYITGDLGYLDDEGFLFVVSRDCDSLKVDGNRFTTSEIEEVLAHHEDVVEAAVAGMRNKEKDEVPVGFIVLKSGVTRDHGEIEKECINRVQTEIGATASFDLCVVADKLPKNRNGKVMRRILKSLVNKEKPDIPPNIEDVSVVDVLEKLLQERNIGAEMTSKSSLNDKECASSS